jgi:uncharacterized protein with ParB-like and HNH nuclease domain
MDMNIQKTFYKVTDFVNWQKNGQLRLSPEFQRRSVWKVGAKSYLIDSIVKGMPIPIIFLRDKRSADQFEPIREVVDGQQRLRTVLSFVCPQYLDDYNESKDSFVVMTAHNPLIAGLKFQELDEEIQQRILDYEFDAHILPTKIDDREIIQIFRRMNSTSYTVNKQELRNAEFFGYFKTSVYNLAAEQLQRWRKWGIFSEDDISRMTEVELTSECIDLMILKSIAGKSPARLDKLYSKYDAEFAGKEELEKRFRYVMDYIDATFGNKPKDIVFLKKTLFFALFAFLYYKIFEFKSIETVVNPKAPSLQTLEKIELANDRLKTRTAPQNVLEATDRRTTNPLERTALFNYLSNI